MQVNVWAVPRGKLMPRILVFGKNGQLASCLAMCGDETPNTELFFVGRDQCDLEDVHQIAPLIDRVQPDVVINAAAYTAVDLAEEQRDIAFKVNRDAVRAMAEALAKRAVPLIHVSTDYVFDGQGSTPYAEQDPVSPLGVYGASKFAGEDAVRETLDKHLIIRTSWVFSQFGKNFVKTMLNLMEQRDEIRVVNDQTGCPTSAHDLAGAILKLSGLVVAKDFDKFGTYHLSSGQSQTWFEFANRIQKVASHVWGDDWKGKDCRITPVPSSEYPTVAKRPGYSVMSSQRFVGSFGIQLPTVEESLSAVIENLRREKSDA